MTKVLEESEGALGLPPVGAITVASFSMKSYYI